MYLYCQKVNMKLGMDAEEKGGWDELLKQVPMLRDAHQITAGLLPLRGNESCALAYRKHKQLKSS